MVKWTGKYRKVLFPVWTFELKDRQGKLLFKGTGEHAGLEIVGDVAKYFKNIHLISGLQYPQQ